MTEKERFARQMPNGHPLPRPFGIAPSSRYRATCNACTDWPFHDIRMLEVMREPTNNPPRFETVETLFKELRNGCSESFARACSAR